MQTTVRRRRGGGRLSRLGPAPCAMGTGYLHRECVAFDACTRFARGASGWEAMTCSGCEKARGVPMLDVAAARASGCYPGHLDHCRACGSRWKDGAPCACQLDGHQRVPGGTFGEATWWTPRRAWEEHRAALGAHDEGVTRGEGASRRSTRAGGPAAPDWLDGTHRHAAPAELPSAGDVSVRSETSGGSPKGAVPGPRGRRSGGEPPSRTRRRGGSRTAPGSKPGRIPDAPAPSPSPPAAGTMARPAGAGAVDRGAEGPGPSSNPRAAGPARGRPAAGQGWQGQHPRHLCRGRPRRRRPGGLRGRAARPSAGRGCGTRCGLNRQHSGPSPLPRSSFLSRRRPGPDRNPCKAPVRPGGGIGRRPGSGRRPQHGARTVRRGRPLPGCARRSKRVAPRCGLV